jgi:aminopeptidase YwaD
MKKVISSFLTCLAFSIAYGQTETEKVNATVTKADIEGHIYFLASDEMKGRATGSPELDIAAQYLATNLRRYGVKPVPGATEGYFQPVKLSKTTAPSKLILKLNQSETQMILNISGQNQNFNGQALFLNYGEAQDYTKQNVKGKLVVVRGGLPGKTDIAGVMGSRADKRKLAQEKGAVGLVELVTLPEEIWTQGEHSFNIDKMSVFSQQNQSSFNHIWVQDTGNSLANALPSQKNITANLTITGLSQTIITSKNVVGMVEGTDPILKNEFIIYSAHYDHVGIGKPNAEGDSIYNGARDNAVGTVTVLSIAENLAKYPTKRSALFILFTGEEKGLLGSKWYVENPLLPLNKMVYCFNSDNAGYNNTDLITIIGLGRTTAEAHIKEAATKFGLTATDDPAPEQGLFDRSDNVNFAVKGIPAPTFSLGFNAFTGDVLKYYHQPADNPNTLDYDYLYKFFRAYVLAGRNIANDPVTPTWKNGDKYQVAGQKLYSK